MAFLDASRFAAFGLMALSLVACQDSNFGGTGGGDQFAATGGSGKDPDRSEDQQAAGEKDATDDGDDSASGKKDSGEEGLGNAEEDEPAAGETQLTGPLADSPCKFFGKTKAAAVIQGGPPTEVKPSDMKGTVEGENYHFDFPAYQGCYGAEAKNNRGDATPHTLSTYVSQITGAFFGNETGDALGEASALGYKGQCGSADQFALTQPKPYAVKHLYRGVVLDAKSVNCVVQAQETEAAFWVREDGNEYSGCFALGTSMRLADGKDRVASLVVEGTELWNPLTKRAVKVSKVVIGAEKDVGMFVVGFAGGTVKVTSTHPFPTAAGLKTARELLPSDRILGADGKTHALTRLEQLAKDPRQVVVNFIVNPDSTDPRDHMLLADGVVTGDLYLQQALAKERLKTVATSGTTH